MVNEENLKLFLEKIAPNVIKAALKGFLMFLLTYLLPTLVLEVMMQSDVPFKMPPEYTTLVFTFSGIVVFFTVVIELFSGMILQHAFSIGRALILMVFFIYAMNGGILTSAVQFPGQPLVVHIFADLRAFLVMLIFVDLLGLAGSMFQTISFLAEKVEAT